MNNATTNSPHTVLVAGATGMLGSQIARELRAKGYAVRALVRNPEQKEKELAPLRALGVEIVAGDVMDVASLPAAMAGVQGVVSALNNQEELIVQGQTNLLRAAQAAGVERFIPSDFSFDFRPLAMGDNFNLDMRKKFLPVLEASGVAFTHILNGGFYEVIMAPFLGIFAGDSINIWGEGKQKMQWTHTSDVARYVAAALFDERLKNKALFVAGASASVRELANEYEAATGRRLELKEQGPVAALKTRIEATKATADNPWAYVGDQYHWAMASGLGAYEPANELFPDIQPMTLREFFTRSAAA
jgi:uncharacterized protein YbjT (DUF2867 family)